MKKLIKPLVSIFILGISISAIAQDDLLDLIDDSPEEALHVHSTFKGTRIINGHSIETPA